MVLMQRDQIMRQPQRSLMPDSTFLNGKVVVRSLPVIDGRPGTDAPRLKRLMLPQGELAQVYDGEPGIRYLAFVELRAGCIRGNHYHHAKEELVYVISGEVLMVVGDINSVARASFTLNPGDQAVISTGVAHALQTVRQGQAIEFSPAAFDAADVHPYALLKPIS
jgi:mannose-6-phosphate isomerase-like protein (cupin superfamily)